MLLVLSSFSLKAQNDSIKIESLYNRGEKEKYINLKASKINFENAIKLIDDNFSNGHNKSDYFSLKKTLILDRLSYYYRKEGNYALSLKTIQESLQLKKMIGEKFTLNETYHNLGRLYLKKKDSLRAMQYFVKAMQLSKKYGKSEGVVDLLNAMTAYYLSFKDSLKSTEYSNKAIHYADSIDYKQGLALAFSGKANCERQNKNYLESIVYSKKCIELSKFINNNIGIERGYKKTGYAYRKIKQPKKAIYYYEKSLELVKSMGLHDHLANRYLSLSNVYTDLKEHEIAFSYYRLYKRQQIKDLNIKSIKEFERLDAKYAYERQKTIDSLHAVEIQKVKEAKLIEEASTNFWKWVTLIISAFSILFIAVYFVLQRRKEQVRLEKIQNELLQNEIDYKKKDLKNLAIDITTNKEWAIILVKKIESLKLSTGRKRAKELIELETEIKNKVKVDEATEEFRNKVDLLSSSFYESLTKDFPNLTRNDIRLCSLIRLDMGTKEIATLQNINPSSVKMSRNRLRKKLNLTPDEQLNKFLNTY
jgi:tetratricopeptide (TPR) repeat protein